MNPDQMTSLIDFADHSKSVLLLWILFVILFLFHVYLCYTVVSVPCSLVITCLEGADLLAFLLVVFYVFLLLSPYCVPGQVWYLIVLIPDLFLPLYFHQKPADLDLQCFQKR